MSDNWEAAGKVETLSIKPPNPVDILVNELKRYVGRRPKMMPYEPELAAEWWIIMQERCKPGLPPVGEEPQILNTPAKRNEESKKRWDFPYALRLQQNFRKFLRLPEDKQRLIIAAQEDGIYWRGDDTEHKHDVFDGRTLFENIIFETERMREMGIAAYRKESLGKMHQCTLSTGRTP